MDQLWVMIFMGVVLKIPVAMMLYTVYWAIKATPDPEAAAPADGDDGHGFRRRMRSPKRPPDPRRGPSTPDAMPIPDCTVSSRPGRIKRAAPARIGEHPGAATERALTQD